MKKPLTFFALLICFTMASMAQGVYQFPNSDFENWDDSTIVPDNWHTFNTLQCDLSGIWSVGCNLAGTNHHNRLSGSSAYGGNGHSLQLYVKNTLGVNANGAITTGQIRVGSITAGDSSNYNYDPVGYRWTFHGRPDSISLMSKKSGGIDGDNQCLFKVYLHDSETFYDHADGSETTEGACYGKVLMSWQPTTDWTRLVKALEYTSTATPSFILGSFSTNQTAGGGSTADTLDLDMLRCIYNKKLATLTLDGTSNTTILNSFNAAEYATHSGLTSDGSNSGSTTYYYAISGTSIPTIGATRASSLATSCMVTQATASNGYKATIVVTHNDQSTFTYNIQFITASVTALDTELGCGTQASTTLTASTNISDATYQWLKKSSNDFFTNIQGATDSTYTATEAGEYIVKVTSNGVTAQSSSVTITANTTLPAVALTTGPTTLCVGNSTTLTASGASSYSWSHNLGSDSTQTVAPTTTTTYTVTGTGDNGCTNTVTATITVNALPAVPTLTVTNNNSCDVPNGTIEVTAPTGNYTYAIDTGDMQTGTTFSGLNSGVYTIIVQDTTTGCTNQGTAEVITTNSDLTAQATTDATCLGDTLVLLGSSNKTGVTFAWYGPNSFSSTEQNPTLSNVTADQAGQYTLTVTEIATNCMATATVNAVVNMPTYETYTESACGSFLWNDTTYTTSGTYTHTFTAANGCDSTVTLNLTILETDETTFTIVCSDTCYIWNGEEYCVSGDYTQTLVNSDGCDSVVTLHLTISVGMDEPTMGSLSLYPNPTSGVVHIDIPATYSNTKQIMLYSLSGQLLQLMETESQTVDMDLSSYATGTYILRVNTDRQLIYTEKIFKK